MDNPPSTKDPICSRDDVSADICAGGQSFAPAGMKASLVYVQGWRFLFFIGVAHAIGALGDGQRGPTFGACGGTEYVLPLHYIFYAISERTCS